MTARRSASISIAGRLRSRQRSERSYFPARRQSQYSANSPDFIHSEVRPLCLSVRATFSQMAAQHKDSRATLSTRWSGTDCVNRDNSAIPPTFTSNNRSNARPDSLYRTVGSCFNAANTATASISPNRRLARICRSPLAALRRPDPPRPADLLARDVSSPPGTGSRPSRNRSRTSCTVEGDTPASCAIARSEAAGLSVRSRPANSLPTALSSGRSRPSRPTRAFI